MYMLLVIELQFMYTLLLLLLLLLLSFLDSYQNVVICSTGLSHVTSRGLSLILASLYWSSSLCSTLTPSGNPRLIHSVSVLIRGGRSLIT